VNAEKLYSVVESYKIDLDIDTDLLVQVLSNIIVHGKENGKWCSAEKTLQMILGAMDNTISGTKHHAYSFAVKSAMDVKKAIERIINLLPHVQP